MSQTHPSTTLLFALGRPQPPFQAHHLDLQQVLATISPSPSPKPTPVYLSEPATTHPPPAPRMVVVCRLREVGENYTVPAPRDTVLRFHSSAGAESLVERDYFCASAVVERGGGANKRTV